MILHLLPVTYRLRISPGLTLMKTKLILEDYSQGRGVECPYHLHKDESGSGSLQGINQMILCPTLHQK